MLPGRRRKCHDFDAEESTKVFVLEFGAPIAKTVDMATVDGMDPFNLSPDVSGPGFRFTRTVSRRRRSIAGTRGRKRPLSVEGSCDASRRAERVGAACLQPRIA